MPSNIDTRNLGTLTGAVYFSVGRGTEGGSFSYRLSVAGVRYSDWGKVEEVAYDSGYTIGTIQVDFGQRGTWPVGAIEGRAILPGEKTYVDAVIEQTSAYANLHRLPFTDNIEKLRSDLLTHGNGKRGRTSLAFIDNDTRNSINAWASSAEGKYWIHRNIDLPQVRGATERALTIINQDGDRISDETRFQAISILAKTANQAPGHLRQLQHVLKDGGDYNRLLAEANAIRENPRLSYFDGPKAAHVAERYASAYNDPARREFLDRAHAKVGDPIFNPSSEAGDLDIQMALSAIGQRSHVDPIVWRLQENLNELSIPDAKGRELNPNGTFDRFTQEATETFQRQLGIPARSPVTADTLKAAAFYAGAPEILRKSLQPKHQPEPSDILQDQTGRPPQGAPPSYRNDWLERDPNGVPNYLHTPATQTPDATGRIGLAPSHDTDLRTDAHSVAMGGQDRKPERDDSGQLEPTQSHSQCNLSVLNADHRDYALFEAIRRQLPNEYSDDMAAHVMLQAKRGGITRRDQIGGMGVENGRMVVMGKSGVDWAIVDLDSRAPAMQETLGQSQAFDLQQLQQHEQWLAQEAQLSPGRGMSRSL